MGPFLLSCSFTAETDSSTVPCPSKQGPPWGVEWYGLMGGCYMMDGH